MKKKLSKYHGVILVVTRRLRLLPFGGGRLPFEAPMCKEEIRMALAAPSQKGAIEMKLSCRREGSQHHVIGRSFR